MTNNHVLAENRCAVETDCNNILLRFFKLDDKTRVSCWKPKLRKLFCASESMHFALFAIRPASSDDFKTFHKGYSSNPFQLSESTPDVKVGDCINILGHPNGFYQKVPLQENFVVPINQEGR